MWKKKILKILKSMVERAVGARLSQVSCCHRLVLLLSCRPGGRRKMLCCSFCSLLSRYWCCSLLMPYYFSLRLLGCGLQCSLCTPSRNHPFKGCRLLSVCHVLMLSFCCLRASLCLLLISARSAVLCNGLFYRIFQSRCFLLVRPFGLGQ